jgi:hypothetical protein
MKIAFIKENTIVNVAEFDSEPLDISIFLQDNNADSHILEGDTRIPYNNFAIGSTFSEEHGIFLKNKPFASWTLNDAGTWVAPVERPEVGYVWDEESVSWTSTSTEVPGE